MRRGASVDEAEMPGDAPGSRRREKAHRGCHVLRRTEPAERRAPDLLLPEAGEGPPAFPREVRLHEARPDRVHRDPARGELERERLRKRDDTALRRGVGDALDPPE